MEVTTKGETFRSETRGAMEASGKKKIPPLKKLSLGALVLELMEVTKKQKEASKGISESLGKMTVALMANRASTPLLILPNVGTETTT